MALIVEDGSGIEDADAYQAISDIQDYAAARGLTFVITDVAAAEAAARRAATWLDATYRTRLPGARVRGRAQGLEWPRKYAFDTSNEVIADDEVPPEWLRANSEAAIRELASPGALSPDVIVGRIEKSVSVSGAVSVTYAGEADYVGSQRPIVTLIDDILSGLLGSGNQTGRSIVKFLNRA